MDLQTIWFALIAVLWVGYFVLEGFDFGVGMLLPQVSSNEADRRAVITTLGPVSVSYTHLTLPTTSRV